MQDNPKILVVDDKRENLLAMKKALEGVNATLVTASSGREALSLVIRHEFALILLDVHMPQMDGFEAASLIRGNESTKHIPIIFVTASHLENNFVFKGYENGAVDYLMKPVDPIIIKSKAKVFIDLYNQRKALDKHNELMKAYHELEATQAVLKRRNEELLKETIEREKAEHARKKSELLIQQLNESNIMGVIRATLDGRIVDANDTFLAMVGYNPEELASGFVRWDTMTPVEFEHQDRRLTEELLRVGKLAPFEKEYLRKDGSRIPVLIGVSLLDHNECVAFILDLSERKSLEAQLLQSQKMEAIGQLAGGVAHDFNNLLMVIKGYGDMVLEEVRDQHELAEQVKEICIAGERAAALTRQLLAFSRKQMLEPRVVNVNDILRNVEKMLRRLIGEDVELTVEQDSTLGNILVDPGQLEQVIMNLCVNARDAMPTGGSLSLKTSNVTIDGEYVSDHPGFAEGEFVQLRVEDTGIGMDEKTKTRIFEPFFTTKEKGKGTGLGLSTVHGIVKQSGGQINVYSELGKGTVFNIYFPRIDKQVSSSSHGGDGVATLRGTEHILLVEDELNVRTLIRKALERHGYRVSEAEHGQHALDLIDAEEGIYDLVITDVVMPRMGGVELIDRVRKLKPEMKFVLMSGYTEHALIQNGTIQEHVTFVNKPCQPQILLQKVRLTLDKGNGQ